MKLYELKRELFLVLKEGRVDPNVLLSISNIIKNGKANDMFQYLMMYRIIEMLKYGDFCKNANFYMTPNNYEQVMIPTQVEIISLLKSLPAETMVQLATKFHNLLSSKNVDELSQYMNINQSVIDWINYVIRKEAND